MYAANVEQFYSTLPHFPFMLSMDYASMSKFFTLPHFTLMLSMDYASMKITLPVSFVNIDSKILRCFKDIERKWHFYYTSVTQLTSFEMSTLETFLNKFTREFFSYQPTFLVGVGFNF